MPHNSKTFDIKFDAAVITHQTAAKIVLRIIELLSFHRKQIPFNLQTYKYMVDRVLQTKESNVCTEDWDNFRLNKERRMAETTLNQFELLNKV